MELQLLIAMIIQIEIQIVSLYLFLLSIFSKKKLRKFRYTHVLNCLMILNAISAGFQSGYLVILQMKLIAIFMCTQKNLSAIFLACLALKEKIFST